MATHRASHAGSFGKGFIDAFLAAMKMADLIEYHKARERYWDAHNFPKDKDADLHAHMREGYGSHPGSFDGTGGSGGGGGQPSHPATGAWWTPDRMSHAVDRLESEAGLSHEGASGLVARWSGIEAGAGPTAYNPAAGGHYGIGQWGRDRGGEAVGKLDFDGQLTHAIGELNGPEKASADVLRRASTPEEGARGASMYERGEDYNASTGHDRFTASTPVQRVISAVGGGAKAATGTGTGKVTTGEGGPLSPAGGPYKTINGIRYETDADGYIGKQAQADLPPGNQVAGGTDEEAMRIAIEANRKLQAQSPAPPPGPRTPRSPYTVNPPDLPPPEQAVPRRDSPAIPRGPTVAAQQGPQAPVPPEAGFPYTPRNEGPETVGRTTRAYD